MMSSCFTMCQPCVKSSPPYGRGLQPQTSRRAWRRPCAQSAAAAAAATVRDAYLRVYTRPLLNDDPTFHRLAATYPPPAERAARLRARSCSLGTPTSTPAPVRIRALLCARRLPRAPVCAGALLGRPRPAPLPAPLSRVPVQAWNEPQPPPPPQPCMPPRLPLPRARAARCAAGRTAASHM
jgi:hypothetical protein